MARSRETQRFGFGAGDRAASGRTAWRAPSKQKAPGEGKGCTFTVTLPLLTGWAESPTMTESYGQLKDE